MANQVRLLGLYQNGNNFLKQCCEFCVFGLHAMFFYEIKFLYFGTPSHALLSYAHAELLLCLGFISP